MDGNFKKTNFQVLLKSFQEDDIDIIEYLCGERGRESEIEDLYGE
jgi:hypothetical protein